MLLAIDIGNSDITLGVWSDGAWKHIWRIESKSEQPELFYGIKIREYFFEAGLAVFEVDTIVLSSVVPSQTEKIRSVVNVLFEREPLILGPAIYPRISIEVLNPYEIGSDLVANAVGAYAHFKKACIVVDFGTALTFTTISDKGKILGVSIVPGLKTAIKSLTQNTAKLFDVPLQMPKSALGINTVTAIQSGILIGYDGLVRHMVGAIRKEIGKDCPTIATGGLSAIVTSLNGFFHTIDPNLTLNGLRIVGEQLKSS
ncbi:MAG: type III pantothenate kinase [Cyclobacteriaceae bacterium]